MSADHLLFLKSKFITEYEEAVEEFSKFPLVGRFQDILKVLQENTIGPGTPIGTKKWLYKLNFALSDCRFLSEKKREEEKERGEEEKERGIRFTRHHKTRFFGNYSLAELWFLRGTQRKLIRIKRKLQRVLKENQTSDNQLSSYSMITVCGPTDFQFFDPSKVYGFQDQLQKMEELLLRESVVENGAIRKIGIVGMGGSGKTTLAQMVFHSPTVRKQFKPMIWVRLSENLNLEVSSSKARIVHEILYQLDKNKLRNRYNLCQMLEELHSNLTGRRYLIVMDNVWDGNQWCFDLGSELQIDGERDNYYSQLSHGLPRGSGGAILVTSRIEEVASKMVGENNLHRVRPVLDSDSCWSIFMDSIRRKRFIKSTHPTLSRIKEEVVEQCGGLPFAAKTLAEIISIQIGQEGFWSDPAVEKRFRLRLDIYNADFAWKVKEKTEALPGVVCVGIDPLGNEMAVIGRCHPVEIVSELGKFWNTELISVETSVAHWRNSWS